ncbi:MAG: CBS domain-containing protein, partial [Planctomycetota bacterium]|nr:CBS domain-containing protein [Planctomycetota bacterium]
SIARQKENMPVHTWTNAVLDEVEDWRHSYRTVGQFMTKDLFTVQPDDLVDLAANVMDWEHIRHVPVEDEAGRLVGLLSHRRLLRHVARGRTRLDGEPTAVRDLMKADPVFASPETPTLAAIELMRQNKVGCLPVVSHGKLVGIITESDLVNVAARLFEEQLKGLPGE